MCDEFPLLLLELFLPAPAPVEKLLLEEPFPEALLLAALCEAELWFAAAFADSLLFDALLFAELLFAELFFDEAAFAELLLDALFAAFLLLEDVLFAASVSELFTFEVALAVSFDALVDEFDALLDALLFAADVLFVLDAEFDVVFEVEFAFCALFTTVDVVLLIVSDEP